MELYVRVKTSCKDLMLNFIEVDLVSGKTVSLNWDERCVDRFQDGFSATYSGICFNEETASGRLSELCGLRISFVELYSDSQRDNSAVIERLTFFDKDDTLDFVLECEVKSKKGVSFLPRGAWGMNAPACADLLPTHERYEYYTDHTGVGRCQYDYRDADGELFSCVRKTLRECRLSRFAWRDKKQKKNQTD